MAVILSRIFSFGRKPEKEAGTLYIKAVEQARLVSFYDTWGVADTLEGRYDMLAMHAFIILHRLKGQGEQADAVAQAFFDVMFRDMDTNLRELGVGDMGVAKRVPKMAEALYGRINAYEEGLKSSDDRIMKSALDRNLYRKTATDDTKLAAMAAYLRNQVAHVANQPLDSLVAGDISWIAPPENGTA